VSVCREVVVVVDDLSTRWYVSGDNAATTLPPSSRDLYELVGVDPRTYHVVVLGFVILVSERESYK
jgi:hypothetical protein